MDVRNFVPAGQTPGGVLYTSWLASPDLEAFRQRDLPAHQNRERRTWLVLWGVNVFRGQDLDKFRPEDWREKLAAVRRCLPDKNP